MGREDAFETGAEIVEARRAAWGDWPSVLLFFGVYACIGLVLILPGIWWGAAWPLLVLALVLHSSLSHEMLHGRPFGRGVLSTVMGAVQPGLFVPYMRFKRLHLAHHHDERLTDPYDDPETGYLDPAVWGQLPAWYRAVLRFNNTLVGRMLVGPLIGQWAMCRDDWALVRAGDRQVLGDWLLHVPGVILVLGLVCLSDMPLWGYLAGCYFALSVLKIRTFLEHQAHAQSAGRTVIIEDRGVFAFLFLNNNFHSVHHLHPEVAWYRLPALYVARRARYLARNEGYVYRSYAQVFYQFMFRAKEPVAHPLWRAGSK